VDKGDLLSTLVFAKSDDGYTLGDKQLMDEAMTLFFAGHETTALSLTWMWYLMAKHPEVQEKARAEVLSVAPDRPLTVEDLRQLPYLDMVVKECMRILPAVWTYMRQPIEDVRMGDHVIEEGAFVFICPYVTQHDDRFFADPEEFRPERFLPENEKALPKGAYVPFSAGPRVCAGKAFAMMESRLILGSFLKHLVAELPDDYEFGLVPMLSLQPLNGLELRVKRLDEALREAS